MQLRFGNAGGNLILYLVSGLSLLLALGSCTILPSSPLKPSRTQPAEEQIIGNENGNGDEADEIDRTKQGGMGLSRFVFISSLLLLSLANCAIELGFSGWIFTYVVVKAGLGEGIGQQVTSLFWLCFMLGRLVALGAASFVSNSLMLAVSMPLAVLGPLLTLLLRPSLFVIVIATALIGLGASTGVGCSLSMANDYLTLDGNLNGLIGTFVGIGATFFPVLVPSLAKKMPWIGWDWLMYATLVAAAAQLIAFIGMGVSGRAVKEGRRPSYQGDNPEDLEDVNAPLLTTSDRD